ncbi:phenylacetate--CoA ligase family protein [Bordetella bronchialis]|uniref:AMP-dependent synthetase n=1 Tax=Bordetella bronchialis TaxID=463025 RepID=A0A193FP92_9BORD|nr:AMP-binding protein [Bordetella bronchialis]ANN68996.1 AMP-dependent synthetase [Bordetella bronchialis]ANN74145.1 AMP-dependent synthetase [Bordetella bronchialis]
MPDSPYFDTLETRPPQAREDALMAALPGAIAHAMAHAPAMAAQLAGVDPARIVSRQALAALPVLRKSELLARQQSSRAGPEPQGAAKAMGGFSALGWGQAPRVFASPGPIYEPESARPDYWRFGRALYAAGIRRGQLVHNCFSYHFTPAGSMMETAAHAIGCTVFPGGTGQSEQQVRAIADLAPAAYTGTPSFLKIILDKADELGIPLPSLRHALLSGEAFPAALRDSFSSRGIEGYQAYGSADLGLIAYETPAREGLVLGEDIIVEIVRPGTGDPVRDGEVGEVVVTTLNPDYPLVRFGTGDLSAVLPGPSPCGRTNTRIRGWLGRADQATKVRGLFVHPSQIADILRRHPEALRARLVVGGEIGADTMTLHVEAAGPPPALGEAIARSARDVTKLRADVVLCLPGSLPNDGKVIEDTRSLA